MTPDPPWIYGPPEEPPEMGEEQEPADGAPVLDFDPREEKIWDSVRDYELELEREPW